MAANTSSPANLPAAPPDTRSKKRQRISSGVEIEAELDRLLSDESIGTVETAILHLMSKYDFDISDLKRIVNIRNLDVSFSRVVYDQIAPLVGLNPLMRLRDVTLFPVHRARIRDDLFLQVRREMIAGINNYGIPTDHENEESRSRYLAPLITCTVAQFKLLIQNTPESMMEGRLATKGRIEYLFRAFGGIHLLFIEVKYRLVGGNELLNVVAQVIAEADACDFSNNCNGLRTTVYGILCDGESFQFFSYDFNATPKVAMGYFPFLNLGSRRDQKLRIPDFAGCDAKEWVSSLRTVCEAIYYVLLLAYQGSLNAYYDKSMRVAAETGQARKSTPHWVSSIGLLNKALQVSVQSAAMHAAAVVAGTSTEDAKKLAEEASNALQMSVESAPPEVQRCDAQLYTAALEEAEEEW